MCEDLRSGQKVKITTHGLEGEDLFSEVAIIIGKNAEVPNLYDALLPNDVTPIQVLANEVTKV